MQKVEIIEGATLVSQRGEIEEIKYRLIGKKILFTSSLRDEGKTSVALALGTLLAETKKVLYIGKPADVFKLTETSRNQICHSNVDNLYILLKENIDVVEVENINSEFDYIFIETEALQISKKAMAIASLCDQTVLVVEANRVSYKVVKENIDLLNAAHAKNIDLVLNKAKKHYGLLKRKK